MDIDKNNIFSSKITLPRLRPNRVNRPELVARIEQNLWRKLTLLCAPAGFGKSTLLRDWAQSTQMPVAWLSLDEDDNLPYNFIIYLVAAIRQQAPDFGQPVLDLVNLPQLPSPTQVARVVLLELEKISGQLVIVMDDYQSIHQADIHATIRETIAHLPEPIHIILASREEPPFPLASMRAKDELYELRMRDLRFNRDEIAQFLNDKMSLKLNGDQIDRLLDRTEGWAAGIQLTALSIQEAPSPNNFILEFTGSNRYILDFLMQEVLDHLDPIRREFLLRCSILDKLTQELCTALSAGLDNPPSLDELEAQNLFLTSMDMEHQWYRFHPLFAEILRMRLGKELGPEKIRELYRTAAEWEIEHSLMPEAMHHYHLAGNLEKASFAAETYSALMLSQGESARCIAWLDSLPREITTSSIGIQLVYGYGLIAISQLNRIDEHVNLAQSLLDSFAKDLPENVHNELLARINSIRALVASETGNIDDMIRLSDLVLPYLPASDAVRPSILLGKSIAYHNTGQTRTAAQILQNVIDESTYPDQKQIHLVGLGNLETVQMEMGKFEEARKTIQEAIDFNSRNLNENEPIMGMVYYGLGILQYETNRLDDALINTFSAIDRIQKWGNQDLRCAALCLLTQIKMSQGDEAGAYRSLKEATSFISNQGAMQVRIDQILMLQLRMAFRSGDRKAARDLLRTNFVDLQRKTNFLAEYLWMERAFAELWLDHRLREDTIPHIQSIIKEAYDERKIAAKEASLCLLLHYHGADARQFDIAELNTIFHYIRSAGYFRTIVDLLPVFEPAVRFAAEAGDEDTREAAHTILSAGAPIPEGEKVTAEESVAALSEREVEVLKLLQAGLSNTDIARRLYLSTGTIKRHLHNIYQKLGVDSRLGAISLAQKEGIL
jgi:LuxR family transcriptional regulator, maltose regulon positive regulatory protein